MKEKSVVPAPVDYETAGSLINPKRISSLPKGKRLTLIDEVLKDA